MALGNRVVRSLPLARADRINVCGRCGVGAHELRGLGRGVLERPEALAHQQSDDLGQRRQKICGAVLLAGDVELRAEHVAQLAKGILQLGVQRGVRRR